MTSKKQKTSIKTKKQNKKTSRIGRFTLIIPHLFNLVRIKKQSGTLLLFMPCLIGLLLGYFDSNLYTSSQIVNTLTEFASTDKYQAILNATFVLLILKYGFLFLLGAFCLRSAGCILNDIADRKIDSQVKRTKDRPLASSKISLKNALILLAILLLAGLFVLTSLPTRAIIVTFAFCPLVVLYPYAKRFFPVPQFILGLVFNCGLFTGYLIFNKTLSIAVLIYYVILIINTIIYDTIYAIGDAPDDKKQNLNSAVIFFGSFLYPVLFGLSFTMHVFLLIFVSNPLYVLITLLSFAMQVVTIAYVRKTSTYHYGLRLGVVFQIFAVILLFAR